MLEEKWLQRAVRVILTVAWLVIAGSLISGIALMAWRDPVARHYDPLSISHPLFFPGLAILIGGTVQGIFMAMVANFIDRQRSSSRMITKKLDELLKKVRD